MTSEPLCHRIWDRPLAQYFLNTHNRLMMVFINNPHMPDCNITHSTSHNQFPQVVGSLHRKLYFLAQLLLVLMIYHQHHLTPYLDQKYKMKTALTREP